MLTFSPQLRFSEPKVSRALDTGAFWEQILKHRIGGRLMSCYIEDPTAESETVRFTSST